MKFSIDRSELIQAVNAASKAVASKGIRPILANILIEAEDSKVRLVGTNTEIMIISEAQADVEKCGKTTAPAKLLLELISSLPADSLFPIIVEHDEKEGKLKIDLDDNTFEVRTMNHADFPPVPQIDTSFTKLDAPTLQDAIKQSSFAASRDGNGNPMQQSLFMDFENNVFVSTDGKRLAFKTVDISVPDELKQGFIVPIKSIGEILNMTSGVEHIQVALFKGQLVFKSDNNIFLTRLLDGKFPDYKRVIPKEHSREITFKKHDLSRALKMVMPFSKLGSFLVVMNIEKGKMGLRSAETDNGKANTSIECELDGEGIEISFNASFIKDFLSAAPTEEIKLQLTTPQYPGVLVSDDVKSVVMPMSF